MSVVEPGGVLRATGLPAVPGGRVFTGRRTVRLGDADQHGRLRLDALARHLQDVATDDYSAAEVGGEPVVWVVRRAAVSAARWPRYLDSVSYATFCGGVGPHWAERRTSAIGSGGARVEAAVLWASLTAGDGRSAPLPPRFAEVWGIAAEERRVSARLLHPSPPPGHAGRPWVIRSTDLDVLGHVNNAAHWAAVEDELTRLLPGRIPVAAECEYRLPIDLGDRVRVVSEVEGGSLRLWLVSDRGSHASAMVTTEPGD